MVTGSFYMPFLFIVDSATPNREAFHNLKREHKNRWMRCFPSAAEIPPSDEIKKQKLKTVSHLYGRIN